MEISNFKNYIGNAVSNISKTSFFQLNSVRFKGGIKEDTVSLSDSAKQIKDIQLRIKAREDELKKFEVEMQKTEVIYRSAQAETDAIKQEGIEEEPEAKNIRERELMKKYSAFAHARRMCTKEIPSKIEKLKVLIEKIKNDPDTAFLYDPDLSYGEKRNILKERPYIAGYESFAKSLNVTSNVLSAWEKAGKFNSEQLQISSGRNEWYINTRKESNKEFFDSIAPKIKTSISPEKLSIEYDMTESKLRDMLRRHEITALGMEEVPHGVGVYSCLIDMSDKNNYQNINKYLRTHTRASRSYYSKIGDAGAMIPATYLQKTGYASVPTIKQLIIEGKVKGKIETRETQEGRKTKTYLDVSSYLKTKDLLLNLKANNPDTVDTKTLSKELGVKISRINQAIQDEEIEIINEYLFSDEKKTVYLSKSNPKNQEFIDKVLFEKQVLEELKEQRKAEKREAKIGQNKRQSCYMTIVWHMCGKTRQIASSLAKQDGYVCKLLIKEDEGKEELTPKEQAKVNSYRKNMWIMAGSEEFSSVRSEARKYMAEFDRGGIEAVSSDWAREIIREYYG